MKIPRNVSGKELISSLQKMGYEVVRQKGSHIRLRTFSGGAHFITIPNHSPLKLGTLSSILGDVALHFKLTKDEVAQKLFG
jgi:predicted RNA binding protein YcfA (HicA-like mRNA interferase family)